MNGLASVLPLWTSRLCLRLFGEFDADALYQLQSDALLTRYAGGRRTKDESLASLRRIIARTASTGFGPLAVEELSSGQVIGWCGIQRPEGFERYEVIYALQVSHWNRGYATEAAAALVDKAMGLDDPVIDEIHGIVFPQNLRSINVLEKLGMTFLEEYYDSKTDRRACVYMATKLSFQQSVARQSRQNSEAQVRW